jgi:ligand-binding sensor domain-containing protein
MVCNSNISFYVMQYGYSRIIKFDKDWNLIKYSSISNYFMITLVDNNVKRLFISRYNGLTEIDENLNLIKSVSVPGNNYGLYFNSTSVQLLVASGSYATINVFNLNLTLIGNITVPHTNKYILEYNGLLYISSESSYMMVLKNQIFHHSFSTLCVDIKNFAIDQNGILAISCSNGLIYLYNNNGSYKGQSWQSPVYNLLSIGFDSNGNLVISNYYGLYIFNSEPLIQTVENSTTFTTCDFCLIKG